VSPPVNEIDGANAVDGAGGVVAVAAAVVAAVVEGVVVELEQAADSITNRRILRRARGITRHEHECCQRMRARPSRGFNNLR
jgi:hypothetical protein